MHSTNYFDAFIQVAEDSPAESAQVPPVRGTKLSIANLQYEMLAYHPYEFTSDEVLFGLFAQRKDLTESEMEAAKTAWFSKGQPCFRASPLTKRYGWGVHANAEGKIALVALGSERYEQLSQQSELKQYKAMRSKRK
ncbi:MAG: DUF6157 family protein [Bacteroidota bacterium]